MTAQVLYARRCRTLEDVKKFYDDPDNSTDDYDDDDHDDDGNDYENENKTVPESWIEISLALKDDLSIK